MKKPCGQLTSVIFLLLILLTGSYHPAYAQSTTQQILFSDEFEKGLTNSWSLERGWTVDLIDGNHVLHGAGHIWVRLVAGEDL